MSIEVKGQLAKLLATEDLLIEHRKVPTASFDVKNRVLTLPIWKDIGNDVYDLLVGHEVAHALYTPVEWNVDDIPKSYLNIVEDARIERMIKRTYPGLNRSFFRGYQQLWEKDFFEIKDKDSDKLPLIDRINLHCKIGDYLLLDFNAEEKEFVDMVALTQTYEDVIEVARKLYQYSKEQKQQETIDETPQNGQQGESETQSDVETSADSQNESEGNVEQTGDDADLDTPSYQDGAGGTNDIEDGHTDESLSRSLESLNDSLAQEIMYCTIPQYNFDNIIIDYKEVLAEYENVRSKVSCYEKQDYIESSLKFKMKQYKNFRDSSMKTVNYLVKEFESKKSAQSYARRAVSRTGVLDMSKLHTYKWNEDVFKKVTTMPDGKNHGMIFFLDWSGSMSQILEDTAKQLLNLVWFCRKVGIAFEVYAFTEGIDYNVYDERCNRNIINVKTNDIFISDSLRLINFFSSRSSKKEFEQSVENFWLHVTGSCYESHRFGLGGTPLADVVLMTPQLIERFKRSHNVEKMSCIYLSDGESCMIRSSITRQESEGSNVVAYGRQIRSHHRTIIRTKTYTSELNTNGCEITRGCLDYIRNLIPDVNLLGVRLIERRAIRFFLSCLGCEMTPFEIENKWKKEKSLLVQNVGYDSVYLLPCDRSLGLDEEEISIPESASKAQLTKAFKKHMGSKMTNKKILTNFVATIA